MSGSLLEEEDARIIALTISRRRSNVNFEKLSSDRRNVTLNVGNNNPNFLSCQLCILLNSVEEMVFRT